MYNTSPQSENVQAQTLQSLTHSVLAANDCYAGLLSGFAVISITGEDAANFLQGQLTCDITSLESTDNAQLGAYCDYKGRVLANFWIWQQAQGFNLLLPTDIASTVQSQLQKYALLSKVVISTQSNWSTLLLCGQKPPQLDTTLVTASLPLTATGHQLYWLMGNTATVQQALDALPQSISRLNTADCERLQILANMSFIQTKTANLFTPQMLSLETLGAVSFKKGCYVGQEVVARTQHLGKLKRHLQHCLITTEPPPNAGDNLYNEKQDSIGIIVATAKQDQSWLVLAVIQDRALPETIYYQSQPIKLLA